MRDDIFSLHRFGQYARATLAGSSKLYIMTTVAYFMLINTIYYLFYLRVAGAIDMKLFATPSMLSAPVMLCLSISAIMVPLFVSLSFYYFLNKNYAVATMMLPATRSEKFTYAALFNLLLLPALTFGLVTLAHLIWSWIYGVEFVLERFPSFRTFIDVSLMTLMMLSLFFYGAIRFRRFNFVFTLISLVIIWVAIYNLAMIINLSFNLSGLALEIVLSGITLAMVLLSWSRFRKLQITK